MSLICYLTRVHFADRVLEDALAEELSRHGIARALIVTDEEEADSDGLDRVVCTLPPDVDHTIFIAGRGGGAGADRLRVAELLADAGCDGILGFGGMAALDLARLVSGALLPLVTIPTRTETIGIGPLGRDAFGQVGQHARLPSAILCDATLTTGAGPLATAAGGMDALIHCLECFLSTAFNPPADGIALDGLRRVAAHLEAAVQDGADLSARRELLAAALNAGLASEKGFGGIEAASHGLEAVSRSRHGVLHGALLSEILNFNSPAVSDRFHLIRMALELPARADPAERLSVLAERIGLPLRLSEIGIGPDVLPCAARRAAESPANRTNPRHATALDYERMMRAIL
ncbi:iron-containing alcohol dehydrogenase [Sedimentitalea sp. JM2-8]|uniref:Iron-containing alcohol dehydrogenase n=1 Tax=Sedimentitalea xiamensis TaxID=3050037 RepID=A0ABT7FI66_9RHOB|nr:iron-containing alcohol dehydrogenase [Sedimentitalea xiamensis]MDK3074628.1 iron-containing alcohol dehydrogenase [Sedimentitalea xiamensis]